ncbi:MAG: fluoride efflux transporter CrcB [Oceanicaulis sp.]|uniref:Fluoride-specific ion channel FluC n=1 Tax=Maricaulis virginensis TaxID=144022 RepID=A0A9W6IK28_9PROT|nr:fluoride efflux transporter CrcB [Maricaulis virginensis]MAC39454.1 fluoride efflux transporter CrcB [Oceanicaulis sp.]MBI74313.1 fluoride efflux transporter CrcB [Oceanicaulis sp.]GLK50944.1 putative fluoride ion transporter CrcB [Maricaulis virginensis]
MNHLLLIAAGGAGGAVSRHLVGQAALRWLGPQMPLGLPWGTLAVNVVGGLAMGLLVGWLALAGRGEADQYIRLAGAVGFLGGFTTFSAYSLELATMVERKAYALAFGYAAGSVVLALGAVFAGLIIMRKVLT